MASDQPQTTVSRTMSTTFGGEWLHLPDWSHIGSVTVPDVRSGETIRVVFMGSFVMVERNVRD